MEKKQTGLNLKFLVIFEIGLVYNQVLKDQSNKKLTNWFPKLRAPLPFANRIALLT